MLHPASTTHRQLTDEQLVDAGIGADLVRMSVGIENADDIIDDIKIGIGKTDGKYVEIIDRKEAIRYAIDEAEVGDVIVLAGKGHEDYQEIKGVKHHFSDREAVEKIVKG